MKKPNLKNLTASLFFISVLLTSIASLGQKLTFDVGLASGSVNSKSYTEANAGLSYYFVDYMAWRNAAFYRFVSGSQNVFGIDTSLRGILALGDQPLGFTAYAGPGIRFVNIGDNAPFVEAGAAFKLAGFAIGAGVKQIYNNLVNRSSENDTQFMIILAGAGAL